MPAVTCSVYQRDGSTLIGDLTLAKGIDATWGERANNNGSLTLPVGSEQAGWLLADAPRVVRVFLDGEAVFDWIVERFQRDLDDESGGTFRFSGSGLRAASVAGQVRPATDCSPTGQVMARSLGIAEPTRSLADTVPVESWGTWSQQPDEWGDEVRAPGFPDRAAEFIWSTAEIPVDVGHVIMFSPDFTVDADGVYVMSIVVDEEYDTYLAGEHIGAFRGRFLWRDGFDTYVLDLCAGETYRWVIDGYNAPRPSADTNTAWALGTIGPATAEGLPTAQNHIVEVETDATVGTFYLRPVVASDPVEVAPNTTAEDLEAFLDAALEPWTGTPSGNVTVTGSNPWTIEFTGRLANIGVPIYLDGTNLADGDVYQEPVQQGGSSSRVMHTDTNWTCIAYPTDPVGLNAYALASLVIGEAQARGDTILDHITYGTMDDSVDARGTAWGFEIEVEVSPYTTTVASILTLIEQQGYDLWFEPGWVLQIAQDRAEDRTPNAVDLSAVSAGTGTSWKGERIVANVATSDSKGSIIEVTSAASVSKHGRWEEHFTTPDGSDPAATSWLTAYLDDVDNYYVEGTVEWSADEPGAPVIGDDVDWADTVTAELPDGTTGDARVVAIGLRVDDENDAVTYRAVYVPQ